MNLTSGLLGHWPLADDCRDRSNHGNHGQSHGVRFTGQDAIFDGRASLIEAPDSPSLRPGAGDLSIAVWAHTDERLDDVLGDLLSKYDPATRTGFNFSLRNCAGVTAAQSGYRHLHFGIDAGRIDPAWTDCGRPGNNLRVYSLTVYEGRLYAGTFEHGADEAGHVYRYAGGTEWIDCGSPDQCNTVASLAVYNGKLYAGSSRYKAGGSALPDSPNQHPGGNMFRYEGGREWTPCGHLEGADSVAGMAVYRGDLYTIPLYSQGVFRYEGGAKWAFCGTPGKRMMSLTVFNGHLYGAGNEGEGRGGVYRYEGGTTWTRTGDQPGVTQVYSFAAHEGKLYAGTWPEGTVFRYDGRETWTNCGRLGEEKEVMAMMVYNGKLYAGTLPLAEVYRYDREGGRRSGESSGGGTTWTRTGQLDTTPDVTYRRVWSMAVYQGKLFGGTLPSGHVYSLEAGKNVTYDHELRPGWRHLAAIRQGDRLKLYVDGSPVATSTPFNPADYDLSSDRPLRIGFGPHDHFNGRLRDLRIYSRALADEEVKALYET